MKQNEKTKKQNEYDCLMFCMGMSDDPKWKEEMLKATHEERVQMLLDNGFTFEEDN